MKILIIAYCYPPHNSSAALRPYAWAKYWQKAGHNVVVFTSRESKKDGLTEYHAPSHGVKIIETDVSQYSKYHKGISQQHARYTDFNIKVKTGLQRSVNRLRELLIPSQIFNRLRWISPTLKYSSDLHMRWPYDIVVSTFDPFAAHIVANRIKNKKKVLWVADYRDLLNGNPFQSRNPLVRLIDRIVEKYFLKPADILTTVSKPLADRLEQGLNKEVVTIHNGFDPEEYAGLKNIGKCLDSTKRIVYMGKIYPSKRDPEPLFRALGNLIKQYRTINIQLQFYSRQEDYLAKLIAKYKLENFVFVENYVEHKRALEIESQANYLLFLDWNNENQKGIMTGKLFEYLYANKPIISIGSCADSDANKLIAKTKSGIILGNSEEKIYKALESIVNGLEPSFEPDHSLIESYNRKLSAEKLLKIISEKADTKNITRKRSEI